MSNKEETDLEKIKTAGFGLGQDILKITGNSDITTLISKHGWKMLNYVNSNNKEKFVEYLYRLYWSYGHQPSQKVFDILQTNTKDKFQQYALAFINGFISDRKQNNKEENNE